MDTNDIKNLKRRYLLWFYKTTKEALDKIERKFTQLEVDQYILKELQRLDRHHEIASSIADFKSYIDNKHKEGLALKYDGQKPTRQYLALALKLKAIEKTIVRELGKGALKEIKSLYEQEMVRRILVSTEH